MNRRKFLAGLASAAPMLGAWRIARALPGKTLVVIFLRGGFDGLNAVVPHEDDDYYRLRPDIAIAPPGGGDPYPAIDLDGFFGLHPALGPLMPIYDAGDLALLPAVHYPDATLSHFRGQDLIESAGTLDEIGWLNRHLASLGPYTPFRAVNFGHDVAGALRGPVIVSSMDDLDDFRASSNGDGVPEAEIMGTLLPVYTQLPDPSRAYHARLTELAEAMVNDYLVAGELDLAYGSGGAQYPGSSFGRHLTQAAQLIKADIGTELITLSLGGWDHHADEGGGEPDGEQSKLLGRLAAGLAAFHADLGTRMDDVLVLTMTEFGRTAQQNGSLGTDHGHASAWLALGGSVNGGLHLGGRAWPGLADHQLQDGRALTHTVDFRDVMAEALERFLGVADPASLLDGHAPAPVGFLRGQASV